MKCSVVWLDAVETEVQRLYLVARAAGLANEFTRATAQIERVLETDPTQAGESRSGHRRILVEPPLTVEFEVHEEQRTVVVTRVRYTPAR